VEHYRPDLLIVDPLFSYCGVDVKDQPALSSFLREGVLPFTVKHNLGLIFIHHTNKPPTQKKDHNQWQAGDFAYAGSGHNELANFPRFVAVLRALGSRSVFELRLAKRWKRAGISDSGGRPIDRVLIKHAAEGISWETASDADLNASLDQESGQSSTALKQFKESENIFSAFHSIQNDGVARIAAVAKKIKVSEKTLRRRFDRSRTLRYGDDVLQIRDGDIRLAPDAPTQGHNNDN
jgi:AraC-like DNA-binding protein